MLLNLVVFLTGVFCLIVVVILIANYRSNATKNIYLIILFIGAFLNRVYFVLYSFGILDLELNYNLNIAYLLIPLYFLMFRELHKVKVTANLILLLIFASGIPLSAKYFDFIEPHENFGYYSIYTSLLAFISINTAHNSLKKSNHNYKSIHFKFSSLILFHVILIYLGTNILMFYSLNDILYIFDFFYKISSLSWLILLGFMMFNPELLFGKKKLENILVENYWEGVTVWSLKPLKEIQDKDVKLSQNISDISNIIYKINKIVKEESDFNHILSIEKLIEILRIPKSHIEYIFKYHCHLTKLEFKNYHQMNLVIGKIKTGFLKNHTMEALIEFSGFKSKMTFYRTFKKITNTTPLSFAKKYSESI